MLSYQFCKKTSGMHFNHHPRTMVFEISIFASACYSHQASFFNRQVCKCCLVYILFKSIQEHFVSSWQWNNIVDCRKL